MKRTLIWFIAGAITILGASEVTATRGLFLHAYGTRATGLGGAYDAVSDDAISSAAYNPAGLTQIKDKRFDMDVLFLRTYLNFKNRNNNPQNGQNGRATAAGFIPEDNLLLNNDKDNRTAKNNYFLMGNMGFATRINEKMVFGAAMLSRGGGAAYYQIKQSPFSFILPYNQNGSPGDFSDDYLVPMAFTRRGTIGSQGTANLPLSDSALQTRPSSDAFFVTTEYSTDLKLPEIGPAIGYKVNDYLSFGVNARIAAGHFRFRQAMGTDSTILAGTGQFPGGGGFLGGVADRADAVTYGEVLSGQVLDPNLGSVQFGYPELHGIGRLENSYSAGFGWGAGIHYRPHGSPKVVLSASYKSRTVIDFKGGDLMMDFSDQFRKFYYDTAQFGEYDDSTFGAGYLSNGPVTLRAPKLFNALLGTIDTPAVGGDAHAQNAMEWLFNGTTKEGLPTLVLYPDGHIRQMNLTAYYDPYTKFALPRELAFGAAWRPIERLLLSAEYRFIYMDDVVGDYFTIRLSSGNSPFFDWLVGTPQGGEFNFNVHTNFNTMRSLSLGAEYDLGDRWIIRGGLQHSNNPFTGKHVPFTFNMQPEDEVSLGCSYWLTDHWELSFAGSAAFTFDTSESKGTEETGANRFVDTDGDGFFDQFVKGSEIDQFHSNAEFDHKQWQLNFGVSYIW